ncbi:hypothetical protein [Streptomyces sp. NPDC088789]|uniref:hypothetical protein n=1 Tax=Streptomyces sp. NPDC088789 TaxID=3365899 RepID=UPI0037F3C560
MTSTSTSVWTSARASTTPHRRHPGRELELAFFLTVFAAPADPESRSYFDKRIAQDERHT